MSDKPGRCAVSDCENIVEPQPGRKQGVCFNCVARHNELNKGEACNKTGCKFCLAIYGPEVERAMGWKKSPPLERKTTVVFSGEDGEVERHFRSPAAKMCAVDSARAYHKRTGRAVCVYEEDSGDWLFAMQSDGTVILDLTVLKGRRRRKRA